MQMSIDISSLSSPNLRTVESNTFQILGLLIGIRHRLKTQTTFTRVVIKLIYFMLDKGF